MNEEINIFKVLDFIRDNSSVYAKAKAERIYLDEFKKSKKAILMREEERKNPGLPGNAQEREALANPEYLQILEALKTAVTEEERLRWLLVAAQTKVEVWRSLSANARAESKNL